GKNRRSTSISRNDTSRPLQNSTRASRWLASTRSGCTPTSAVRSTGSGSRGHPKEKPMARLEVEEVVAIEPDEGFLPWYVSWSGVFVGALSALALLLVFGLTAIALGALTALLLGLVGSVVGGWMGSGERMSLNYSKTPHRQHGRAWGETR